MDRQFDATLASVAEKTLAELAFVFSMPDEEAVRHVSSALVAASVDFSGPFSGSLTVGVSANMLPAIASNMLGLDEGEGAATPEQQRDALKELANVVCGNLLPKVAGTEVVFKIDAPEVVDAGRLEEKSGAEPVSRIRLILDEGRAEMALFVQGEVPALAGGGAPKK